MTDKTQQANPSGHADPETDAADTTDTEAQKRHEQAAIASFIGHTLCFLVVCSVAMAMIYHYWHGEFGRYQLQTLQKELIAQQQKNHAQQQKNARLAADVHDLKTGLVAIEEHARLDLGLIKKGEIFVQIAPKANISDMPDVRGEVDAVEILEPTTIDEPMNQ